MRLAVAVVVSLACATAHADDAADARAHYESGQKLYDQGRYDESITEYETAYRLKPHPNVLYNIAQAHERLLEYGESVKWFERYLAEAPPDAEFRTLVENRLRVLRGLPARLSITTLPEHVHARITCADGRVLEAETPTVFKIPAGKFELTLSHPGWEPESHDGVAELGQPYIHQYRLKRSTSRVTIFSRPRGARVFVDDKLVGETPYADVLEVGRHKLLLEHPEYPWHQQTIDVKAGQPLELEIKLSRPIRSGRTELVLASMIYGGIAGPMLVAAASGNSNFINTGGGLATMLGASALGIGAGFLGSFYTTRDGIKVGHASLIIGGGAWGTGIGASLALGLKETNPYIFGLGLLGGGLGITAAALVVRWKDVMPGTAAIFNSGGFWGAGAGALLTHAIFDTPGLDQFGWFILGGTALGLITSGLIAWKLDRARGHVALVDAGGLVGTGLGFALGVAVAAGAGATNLTQAGCRYALGGMALGILAAALATRHYKGDLPPTEALIQHENGRWAFGLPKIDVTFEKMPAGDMPKLTATLATGHF
jgi:hypothetical protein